MRKLNFRKWWYFANHTKSIRFEMCFDTTPLFRFEMDGCEREVQIAFWFLFFQFYIIFERFLPERWFPKEYNSYSKEYLHTAKREVSLNFHDYAVWWVVWMDDDVWDSKTPKWRQGSWHPFRNFKGKHTVQWIPIDVRPFVLPFLEGNYNIEVAKNKRIDRWQRWFTSTMITFEARVGYYDENNIFVEMCVPHEGKGENSWDQGEDGTFKISFPARFKGQPAWEEMRSCEDAALYFWQSCMRDRINRGSANWLPAQFRGKKVEIIKKQQLS